MHSHANTCKRARRARKRRKRERVRMRAHTESTHSVSVKCLENQSDIQCSRHAPQRNISTFLVLCVSFFSSLAHFICMVFVSLLFCSILDEFWHELSVSLAKRKLARVRLHCVVLCAKFCEYFFFDVEYGLHCRRRHRHYRL